MLGLDLGPIVQGILFLLFADVTAIVAAVIGPTYDQLLVPELSTGALYPPVFGPGNGPGDYLAAAGHFSTYLLAEVVDPAATLVALGVAVAYLSKPLVTRWSLTFDSLLPRLVLGVVGANFSLPIAGGLLGVGGALYPVVAGWDGGAWQHWVNLGGWGEISFSFDNGALAFLLSVVEFTVVLGLVLAVGIRDALLAVLIVLLPVFTLLWPFRPLSPLARRAWFLFGELVFLPSILVVPLELAVGSPTPVALVAYLTVALASPFLLSLAGTHLVAFGFPGAAGTLTSGLNRGSSAVPSVASARLASPAQSGGGAAGTVVAGAIRMGGSASVPVALPLSAVSLVGHGAVHLVRHFRGAGATSAAGRWPPVRGGPEQ